MNGENEGEERPRIELLERIYELEQKNAQLRGALEEIREICSGGEMPSSYIGKCEEIAQQAVKDE